MFVQMRSFKPVVRLNKLGIENCLILIIFPGKWNFCFEIFTRHKVLIIYTYLRLIFFLWKYILNNPQFQVTSATPKPNPKPSGNDDDKSIKRVLYRSMVINPEGKCSQ